MLMLPRFGKVLYCNFVKQPTDPKSLGAWAIITGCTSGIGLEFATSLAEKGMNLVLVSRSKSKLETLAEHLQERFGVCCMSLAFDFLTCTPHEEEDFYSHVLPKALSSSPINGDVGLLVNNVGVGDEVPLMTDVVESLDVMSMIKVNCGATVNMSRALLPLFTHRKKGAVINVSSGSAQQPTPYLSVYSSTKAFIKHFSACCGQEYKDMGIEVMCIVPYYVSGTGMCPARPSINAPPASVVTKGALSSLGRHTVSHTNIAHALIDFGGRVMESPAVGWLVQPIARFYGLPWNLLQFMRWQHVKMKNRNPLLFEKHGRFKAVCMEWYGRSRL